VTLTEAAAHRILREHARTPDPERAAHAAVVVATAARRRGDPAAETSALLLAATAAADSCADHLLPPLVERLRQLHGPHAAACLPEPVACALGVELTDPGR